MVVLWGGAALRRADKCLDLCAVLRTVLQPRERRHSLVVLPVVLFCFADGSVAPQLLPN